MLSDVDLRALPADDTKLIPARDLSFYIGVSASTAARWRCEGDGPAFVKLGHRVFYRAGDLRSWMNGNVRRNTGQGGRSHA